MSRLEHDAAACPPEPPGVIEDSPRQVRRGEDILRRLAAIDWLLIGTLLPIGIFGVVMSVLHGVRGDFVVAPFGTASAPDGESYPTVSRLLTSQVSEVGALAPGDRLLNLDGSDLRGVSNAGFILRWSRAAQAGSR